MFGAPRGKHFDLHLGHVDAGRTFVAAGLAGTRMSFIVSIIASDESASRPSWPEIASRSVLARPRVTSFSLRVAR